MTQPIRIGILNDMADGPPNPSDIEHWLRLVADAYVADGRLERPLEFVNAWGLGLPAGSAAAVERAYAELAAQDVLMIVGPAIGDNALVATPLAERFRLPTLNWAGAETARGDFMFQLQVGSHEDESIVLARHLASVGSRRVGVAYDDSPIGHRHFDFLRAEAKVVGLDIAASALLHPLAENADAAVATLLGADIDALLYLGLGLSAPAVARAVSACGWDGLRAMNTAGIRGYAPAFARMIDGWIYVDMYSDHNTTLTAFHERAGAMAKNRLAAAKGYDLGRLVAEAVARAPEPTRAGLKAGLERVKWLPAAQGREGTLLGFGNYDRGALHGRYLVLRQWRDGRSLEVA